MADFRQNSPDIRTSNSTFSYTSDNGAAVSALGTGITNAFSAYVEGKDNAAIRAQRARSLELSELAHDRAVRGEQRDIADYEYKLETRRVEDVVAMTTMNNEWTTLLETLNRTGIDISQFAMPLDQYSPQDAQVITQAANTAERNRNISSGSGHGATIAAVRNMNAMRQFIEQNQHLSAEINAAFKVNTGKSLTEYNAQIMDTLQHAEISAAEAEEKRIQELRSKLALSPDNYTDAQVVDYAAKLAAADRRTTQIVDAGRRAGAASQMDARQTELYIRANAQNINLVASGEISGLFAETLQRGGTLDPATFQQLQAAGLSRINQIRAGMIAQGVSPSVADGLLGGAVQQFQNWEAFASGKTPRDMAVASLEAFKAASENANLNTLINPQDPGAGTFGDLVFQTRMLDDILGSGAGDSAKLKADTVRGINITAARPGLGRLGAVRSVGVISNTLTGGALSGIGAGPLSSSSGSAAVQDAGIFANITLGAAATNRVKPDQVTLSANRSFANIPSFLRPSTAATPATNTRLDLLNRQLGLIANDPKSTDARVIQQFIKGASDINTAGTYHIDPSITDKMRELIPEYYRRMLVGMSNDTERMLAPRGNTTADAFSVGVLTARGQIALPSNMEGLAVGNGIDMVERPDGGVTYRPAPTLTGIRLAEATRLSAEFNRKYAPRMREVVRSYAHIFQGNQDYRSALATIKQAGASLGDTFSAELLRDTSINMLRQEYPDLDENSAANIINSIYEVE